ncbi:hypothetical protein Hanom_Chr09g00801221 [Helianthus anomalus]
MCNFYCSGCKYELKMFWLASMKIYVFVYELKTFGNIVYIIFIFNDMCICVALKLL